MSRLELKGLDSLTESLVLDEDYSKEIPQWFMDSLRDTLPRGWFDKFFKEFRASSLHFVDGVFLNPKKSEPDKIGVWEFTDGRYTRLWIQDFAEFSDFTDGYNHPRGISYTRIPVKQLKAICTHCGYIDVSNEQDTYRKRLVNNRTDAKSGSIDREFGQYKSIEIDDNDISNSKVVYKTFQGRDKSGYLIQSMQDMRKRLSQIWAKYPDRALKSYINKLEKAQLTMQSKIAGFIQNRIDNRSSDVYDISDALQYINQIKDRIDDLSEELELIKMSPNSDEKKQIAIESCISSFITSVDSKFNYLNKNTLMTFKESLLKEDNVVSNEILAGIIYDNAIEIETSTGAFISACRNDSRWEEHMLDELLQALKNLDFQYDIQDYCYKVKSFDEIQNIIINKGKINHFLVCPDDGIVTGEYTLYGHDIRVYFDDNITQIYGKLQNATVMNIPKSLQIIGKNSLRMTHMDESITTLVLDNIQVIDENAFPCWGTIMVEQVILGNSVTRIGAGAFGGFDKLKHINIPGSVKQLGNNFVPHLTDLVIDVPNEIIKEVVKSKLDLTISDAVEDERAWNDKDNPTKNLNHKQKNKIYRTVKVASNIRIVP